MASLAPGIAPQHATSLDLSHNIMIREGYERDDWRILTLNDAAEDALSKILRFGFDIDRDVVKTDVAMRIKNQIFAWAKHISDDIPGYSNWQEVYDFTFDALDSPDAVPGEDATPIGTEADLVNETADYYQLRDYALLDRGTEKADHADHADHALSLVKARNRQEILDLIRAPYSAANPMPHNLALLFRKIRYTYKLRECLLGQAGYYNGAQEFAANISDDFEFYMYLVQMKLRRPDRLHIFKAPKAMANYITDSTCRGIINFPTHTALTTLGLTKSPSPVSTILNASLPKPSVSTKKTRSGGTSAPYCLGTPTMLTSWSFPVSKGNL
jgi:hypothetical protein